MGCDLDVLHVTGSYLGPRVTEKVSSCGGDVKFLLLSALATKDEALPHTQDQFARFQILFVTDRVLSFSHVW